jgi:hypothetical protein
MKAFAVILCSALLSSVSLAYAEDIQLLLPQNNVSSRPVLEFRARDPSLGGDGRGSSAVGHAYVLLGRELNDGLILFNEVKGFYPAKNDVVHYMFGKGAVKQTLDDASQDVRFRVYITPLQETKIRAVFKKWEDKNYNLALQNCVDFTRAVAREANLEVPFIGGDLSQEFPSVFVRLLKQSNDKNTPLRTNIRQETGPAVSPQVPQTGGGLSAPEIAQKHREIQGPVTVPQTPIIIPPPGQLPTPIVVVPPPTPPTPPQPPYQQQQPIYTSPQR